MSIRSVRSPAVTEGELWDLVNLVGTVHNVRIRFSAEQCVSGRKQSRSFIWRCQATNQRGEALCPRDIHVWGSVAGAGLGSVLALLYCMVHKLDRELEAVMVQAEEAAPF